MKLTCLGGPLDGEDVDVGDGLALGSILHVPYGEVVEKLKGIAESEAPYTAVCRFNRQRPLKTIAYEFTQPGKVELAGRT